MAEPADIEPKGVAQPASSEDSAKPATQTLQDNPGDSPQPEVAAAASTKTPHDWAQYFIQRCGYRLDQAITPKTMVMFRDWIAKGLTLEDVEDAVLAAQAKLGPLSGHPALLPRVCRRAGPGEAAGKRKPGESREPTGLQAKSKSETP